MSENIFTEIYNKILGLFGQSAVKDESKNTAVNRLRLVLMQDRTNLTPEIMNRMRSELIEVLSKYVELDKEALDLNIGQEGEQMALMLSIPVIRAKDEAEIQETLKKEDELKKALEEKTEEESEAKEETEETAEESEEESEEKAEEGESEENSEEQPEEKDSEKTAEPEETEEEQESEAETKSEEEETDAQAPQEEKPKKKKENKETEEK